MKKPGGLRSEVGAGAEIDAAQRPLRSEVEMTKSIKIEKKWKIGNVIGASKISERIMCKDTAGGNAR